MDEAFDEIVPARAGWSRVIAPGTTIRITDLAGQQAVDALFYAWPGSFERYAAQETLAAQSRAYIGLGSVLLSNAGRPLMTVVADSTGRHDTSAGACSCEANTVRFGHHTRHMHACRENFLLELAKYDMGKRDIVSNVNFFMNVPIRPDGELAIVDGLSAPGNFVDLRAETAVLVVLSNCPQVNNPCNGFTPTPIRVSRV